MTARIWTLANAWQLLPPRPATRVMETAVRMSLVSVLGFVMPGESLPTRADQALSISERIHGQHAYVDLPINTLVPQRCMPPHRLIPIFTMTQRE